MKQSTLDLLERAKRDFEFTDAEWCRHLGVNRTALSVARLRGRLTPAVAGNLARLMGEDPSKWITIAALEAEPDNYPTRKLISVLNLYFSTAQRLRVRYGASGLVTR